MRVSDIPITLNPCTECQPTAGDCVGCPWYKATYTPEWGVVGKLTNDTPPNGLYRTVP